MAAEWQIKISREQREEIRKLFATGLHKQKDLAAMFGCAASNISKILNWPDAKAAFTPEERKQRRLEACRKSQRKHRDQRLAKQRERYAANKERERQRVREYRERNPDVSLEYSRWYEKNKRDKERANALSRSRYAADPQKQERHRAEVKQWAKDNPEKFKALSQRNSRKWYARKNGAPGDGWGDLWSDVVECWSGLCAYCLERPSYAADHVHPLSRGGTNHPSNLLPACTFCNSQKGAKLLQEWRPELVTRVQEWQDMCRNFDAGQKMTTVDCTEVRCMQE